MYVADVQAFLARTLKEEDAQGLTEYSLILLLIAIVAILALTFLGQNITSILSSMARAI